MKENVIERLARHHVAVPRLVAGQRVEGNGRPVAPGPVHVGGGLGDREGSPRLDLGHIADGTQQMSNGLRSLASDHFNEWSVGLTFAMPLGYRLERRRIEPAALVLPEGVTVVASEAGARREGGAFTPRRAIPLSPACGRAR